MWNIAIQLTISCSAYKLIYVVRVLTARKKIIVKHGYWQWPLFSTLDIEQLFHKVFILCFSIRTETQFSSGSCWQTSDKYGSVCHRALDGVLDPHWKHGSCTHTQEEPFPIWGADLWEDLDISYIDVLNRDGDPGTWRCCTHDVVLVKVVQCMSLISTTWSKLMTYIAQRWQGPNVPRYFVITGRLSNFCVLISDVGFPVNSSMLNTDQFHLCGQFPGIPPAAVKSRVKCPWGGIMGRYVYITLPRTGVLTLCEVQIYGGKALSCPMGQICNIKTNIV